MKYLIVRNGNFRQTWNWRRRQWCWDLDGDYSRYEDGYSYYSFSAAKRRQQTLRHAYPESDIDVYTETNHDALRLRTIATERGS